MAEIPSPVSIAHGLMCWLGYKVVDALGRARARTITRWNREG